MKILEFPNLRQAFDFDCGAVAVQSVLAYYGVDINEEKIIKMSGTNKKHGTLVQGILKTLKRLGLKTKAGKLTIDELKKYLDKCIPVILLVQAWPSKKNVDLKKSWKYGHYVVAIGYDKHKIYFADPLSIVRTYLTYDELFERWHDRDARGIKYINYGVVVLGAKRKYTLRRFVHMD